MKTYEIINKITKSISSQDESENNSFSEYSSFSDDTPSTSNSAYSKLTLHVDQLSNTSYLQAANQNRHMKAELLDLCEQQRQPFEIDVLDYWSKHSQRNLCLIRLVEVALAVPATQVSVERAFSALATVLTKLRSKLSNKSLSNILITKLNFELIDCSDLQLENGE